jgi:hypothetical protein
MATIIKKNTMTASIDKLEKILEKLPSVAYDIWIKNTPKKSGNARRKTQLKGRTIHADYAYAKRLNEGLSKQSPNGMSEETSKALDAYLTRNLRK